MRPKERHVYKASRYEAREPDGSSSQIYRGKRAYVYDIQERRFIAVLHVSEAYPDPMMAAEAEAQRLNVGKRPGKEVLRGDVAIATPTEQAIISKVEHIVGYVPIGTLDLLHILVHPDVIALTGAYIKEVSRGPE